MAGSHRSVTFDHGPFISTLFRSATLQLNTDTSRKRMDHTNETRQINSTQKRNIAAQLLVIAMCLLAIFLLSIYIAARPAVKRDLLTRIKTGMSKDQVSLILGEPNRKYGPSDWRYWRWGNTGWVKIKFDDSNEVLYVNDESTYP